MKPQMSYPFLVWKMSKMIRTIIVLVPLCIGYIQADCNAITLDECGTRLEPPFEQAVIGTISLCQRFCNEIYHDTCKFFTFNKKDHTCTLYDVDPVDFAESCNIVGGTPEPNPYNCTEPTDPCAVRKLLLIYL